MKGMRVAEVRTTLEKAKRYLENGISALGGTRPWP